jgi:hypothetical protein
MNQNWTRVEEEEEDPRAGGVDPSTALKIGAAASAAFLVAPELATVAAISYIYVSSRNQEEERVPTATISTANPVFDVAS